AARGGWVRPQVVETEETVVGPWSLVVGQSDAASSVASSATAATDAAKRAPAEVLANHQQPTTNNEPNHQPPTANHEANHQPPTTNNGVLEIHAGRHPVVESQALGGERFVPNDLYLDRATRAAIVLTGPNMGGKSTYLRQTALAVIL